MDATLARITAEHAPHIGGPLANVRAYVLNERLSPAPVGVRGELYIGGAGVAKAQVLSAQAHQDLPFDQVVERVKPPRSTAHPPLFQVMFVWQNMPAGELTIPGLTIRAVETPLPGRNRTEVEALIGFFVNTLALRLDLSSEPTVGELLKRTKAQVLSAQAHQDLPFDQDTAVLPPIPLAPRDGRIALSLAQQRLWFLTQLEGVSEAYHMSGAVRLDGPLNRHGGPAADTADATRRKNRAVAGAATAMVPDATGRRQRGVPHERRGAA
nr:condensation domain-containing protein [Burkholderia pseudomallei]